jgi:hypothetical protein
MAIRIAARRRDQGKTSVIPPLFGMEPKLGGVVSSG